MNARANRVWVYLSSWVGHWRIDRGASLVEYALLVALIAVVCVAAITLLGNAVSGKFSSIGKAISSGS